MIIVHRFPTSLGPISLEMTVSARETLSRPGIPVGPPDPSTGHGLLSGRHPNYLQVSPQLMAHLPHLQPSEKSLLFKKRGWIFVPRLRISHFPSQHMDVGGGLVPYGREGEVITWPGVNADLEAPVRGSRMLWVDGGFACGFVVGCGRHWTGPLKPD